MHLSTLGIFTLALVAPALTAATAKKTVRTRHFPTPHNTHPNTYTTKNSLTNVLSSERHPLRHRQACPMRLHPGLRKAWPRHLLQRRQEPQLPRLLPNRLLPYE